MPQVRPIKSSQVTTLYESFVKTEPVTINLVVTRDPGLLPNPASCSGCFMHLWPLL